MFFLSECIKGGVFSQVEKHVGARCGLKSRGLHVSQGWKSFDEMDRKHNALERCKWFTCIVNKAKINYQEDHSIATSFYASQRRQYH